jgi:hypothetical protein
MIHNQVPPLPLARTRLLRVLRRLPRLRLAPAARAAWDFLRSAP